MGHILDELTRPAPGGSRPAGAQPQGSQPLGPESVPAHAHDYPLPSGTDLAALLRRLETQASWLQTAQLLAGAVTTPKLGSLAVDSTKLADNAVITAKLADLAVIANKLADLAVTTPKVNDAAITTVKMNDLAVTTAKIGLLAVGAAQIADLGVTNAKINDLSVTKLTAGNLTVAAVLVGGSIQTAATVDATHAGIKEDSAAITAYDGLNIDYGGGAGVTFKLTASSGAAFFSGVVKASTITSTLVSLPDTAIGTIDATHGGVSLTSGGLLNLYTGNSPSTVGGLRLFNWNGSAWAQTLAFYDGTSGGLGAPKFTLLTSNGLRIVDGSYSGWWQFQQSLARTVIDANGDRDYVRLLCAPSGVTGHSADLFWGNNDGEPAGIGRQCGVTANPAAAGEVWGSDVPFIGRYHDVPTGVTLTLQAQLNCGTIGGGGNGSINVDTITRFGFALWMKSGAAGNNYWHGFYNPTGGN